jgi:vacuolar-type H+-ATPase catalytic subunit A/Vma1
MSMVDAEKEKYVSIPMSISGLQKLIGWLNYYDKYLKQLGMTWEEEDKQIFNQHVDFLNQVLENQDDYS